MRAENWKTIKEILRDVLQIEPSKRGEFLERTAACLEIRSEVESLLACEAESADFMSLPITDFSKDFTAAEEEEPPAPLAGQKIGIYEIVREIGFGGMGAVYLATRCDGKFEQQVAVKMLKREFNTEKIRRYFRREREIQSKLNHPNIARLLDAGTTGDGVPFLVMEYVSGLPIDEFCETNKLALNARLKLFNRVCDAVTHAHRNLTVHRDLKPSNILVNNEGEPKLLDFGISKLLDAENIEDKQAITILGAMTPEYASPEQIKGEPVTTATDIYSLGVVLFKILTGNLPYNFKNKTNRNLLKEVTDSEPLRPSAAVNAANDKTNLKPQILNSKSLIGDLDNIILKSLSKEPARRYQTVEQFAADIWRNIDGLPVLARPATFAYRASKFYGRNKVAVLAGIFILVSLFTGLTIALWQADVARGQARIATDAQRQSELETEHAKSEEEKARTEKEKAEKISRFMLKVLSYANPAWHAEGSKFGGETKVIEVMDELRDQIDVEFANQPDVQSDLHHKFADVYLATVRGGRTDEYRAKALYHARRALELRREFYGERHELVAKDMAYLYWANGVEKQDEGKLLAEAIQMMRETNPHNLNLPFMFEAYTSRLMMSDARKFHDQYRQAVIPATDENKYQIAERYLLESLPIFREHYKVDNLAIYANECKLAYAQIKQNKFTEAAPHHEICKDGATKLQRTEVKAIKRYLSEIEKTATENNP